MSETEPTLDETRNLRARSAAQAAAERLTPEPTGVVHYESRGRVLVIGGEEAQWLAARVAEPLHAEILLTHGDEEAGVPTTALGGRAVTIQGHLGAFRIELGEQGRHNYQRIDTDLVVDLGMPALITSELPPPGYWRFGCEPADLDAACLALDGMLGTFEKPRYFAYDPAICAHGRAGQPGCSRCLDACPADAIISVGETVEVNPKLCQGGGICASVCPTGAMRYAYPHAGDTAERVRLMLRSYLEAGGTDPVVMFVAASDAVGLPSTPPNVLLIVVEELASVGHEIWLAAIAWGARCILLADGGSVPGKARRALDEQIGYCQQMLRGLGYQGAILQTIDARASDSSCAAVAGLPAPARFTATGDKRQLAALGLAHLWQASPERPESFALSSGAPYGRVRVDSEKCTLCMSCTSVCPARALSAGDETPRLVFHEANCVQCGICANACPEVAITLEPRLLADPDKRRQATTLHEEPPFCCIGCGTPFATRRVIDNIMDKLAGHAMFQSERARRRLQMCEDCRVVDAVQDSEAMQASLGSDPIHRSDNGKSS